ncbi:MAG: DUF1653 domain-containing protein [Candidatus Pacebacteria bacterium]|nr:DUF1653 domain-containing protein [Candidatus Paceibacterota bacterium]
MNNETLKRGIYQHFKDKSMIYEVIGVGMHTETEEKMVAYRALYGDFKLYIRPLEMFIESVDKPELNYKGPRFIFIKELE